MKARRDFRHTLSGNRDNSKTLREFLRFTRKPGSDWTSKSGFFEAVDSIYRGDQTFWALLTFIRDTIWPAPPLYGQAAGHRGRHLEIQNAVSVLAQSITRLPQSIDAAALPYTVDQASRLLLDEGTLYDVFVGNTRTGFLEAPVVEDPGQVLQHGR